MLSETEQETILELSRKGASKRQIARLLKMSRATVRRVLAGESPTSMTRSLKGSAHHQRILELFAECKGNRVRVHEELVREGTDLSYPALTDYCRRHQIGAKPKKAVGTWPFEPGHEIQHDTSPHEAVIAGKKRRVQTASAVCAFSRMMFFQGSPRFRRFDCKAFLTSALEYFGGSPSEIMIDNTHVVVLRGTGQTMVPVPEMEGFAQRFGFVFRAHEKGYADRSARVERPFHYIENNFFAGRTFDSWEHLNQLATTWCDEKNATYKRHLKARPIDLFVTEKAHLRPLPLWIPEPERIEHRIVDVYAYAALDGHRYSVPEDWIGRQVRVRETRQNVEILLGRETVQHVRQIQPDHERTTLPEHRPRPFRKHSRQPPPERAAVLEQASELSGYVERLEMQGKRNFMLALRRLLQMVRDYPRKPLLAAIAQADHYGLYDLERVEAMILKRVARDYFQLQDPGDPDDD